MARKFRPRKEYRFWLYHDLAEDVRIMEFIKYCKATKQFAGVIRDGIRLIWSLREGNMAVLFEMFPHLEQQFKPDSAILIEEFKQMLLHQKPAQLSSGVGQVEDKPIESSKGLASKVIAMPIILDDDDDQDTIVLTKAAISGNSDTAYAAMMKIAF